MSSPTDYAAHGWALVPIPQGKKGPTAKGWNTRERCVLPETWQGNVGLAHAYSGTCAIDIDDLEHASAFLKRHDIDLDELLKAADTVLISSGRPNRAKLLYRLTDPLASKKIIETVETSDGPLKQNIIDFRCATRGGATVQDVLPPSIHPDTGKPYEWVYGDELVGDWHCLPEIPAALLAVWQSLIDYKTPETVTAGAEPTELISASRTAPDSPDLDELRKILEHEDANTDRDAWVRVLAMIHWETRGSDEGLALACEWSASGAEKFVSDEDVGTRWRSFSLNTPNPVTAASYRVDVASEDDFTVIEATDSPIVASSPGALPALKFDTDEDGFIFASKDNLRLALSRPDWCGQHIALDTFRSDILIGDTREELRSLKDTDYERFGIWLELNGFKTITHDNMRRSLAMVADDNTFDSATDWLKGLTWDGVPRVERFLADYFAAGDTPYTRAVSLYWWTAHAGRVLAPGCKADMVPILVGPQGIGKSSGVAAIAPSPENFVEVRLDQDDDVIARRISRRLVGEIGELRGLQSRESESIKSMITTTHDTWVPKYVERAQTIPRRVVFIGTTNSEEFLADETGNRRWLPVRVGKVRVQAIIDDRLQLWAEARELFEMLGVAFDAAERLAVGAHAAHMIRDVWEENITRWLDGTLVDDLGGTGPARRDTAFTMGELLAGALGLDVAKVTMREEHRAGKILRVLGFTKKDVKVDGRSRKAWSPLVAPLNDTGAT